MKKLILLEISCNELKGQTVLERLASLKETASRNGAAAIRLLDCHGRDRALRDVAEDEFREIGVTVI